jgi:hypothetical protein
MTRYRLVAAAVILAAATATPVLAQAVIQEPGSYAFYYPNADLGLGSARLPDAMASEPLRNSGNMARFRSTTMSHPLPARRARSIKPY